jgi:prevent-host-death family protein
MLLKKSGAIWSKLRQPSCQQPATKESVAYKDTGWVKPTGQGSGGPRTVFFNSIQEFCEGGLVPLSMLSHYVHYGHSRGLFYDRLMKSFSAKDAKNHFGQVIDTARASPVVIEKHGRPVVVVCSVEEFERLRGREVAGQGTMDAGRG